MSGDDIQQQDLVISQLLTQDINKYKGLFPNVSVAIQIHNNNSGKYPMLSKRDTNSQHKSLYWDYGMVRKGFFEIFQ
jgi:hypothetical protein